MEENLRPSPVSVTTPTMIPAAAQVEATLSTPVVPASIACTKRRGTIADSRRKKLTTKAVTVAQKTLTVGENPMSMKITIDKSDRKWNQYFFASDQALSTTSKAVWLMPYLRASNSTIRNSEK